MAKILMVTHTYMNSVLVRVNRWLRKMREQKLFCLQYLGPDRGRCSNTGCRITCCRTVRCNSVLVEIMVTHFKFERFLHGTL